MTLSCGNRRNRCRCEIISPCNPGGCGLVPPPTIDIPSSGSVLSDPSPWIVGHATPGYAVRVCLRGYGCQVVSADPTGEYRARFEVQLPDGPHIVTATQIHPACGDSPTASSAFTVDTSTFLIEPIELRMGRTFRTVDADVLITGASGPATVHYLLLPPGSPAPSEQEILAYSNTAALLDGTAATGRFEVDISPAQTLYTWALTGLDNPSAPAGATGVIDGYRYDGYLYIVFATRESGVLSFGNAAMGMPFATGLGTPENPFTIRELEGDELLLYPDLIEGNPLNEPGVDETGRMLENIERLITLYERTDGYYGLGDSMELSYLMTGDIDLAVYALAYGGQGWQSIGDIDGFINDEKETEHLFMGDFSGGGHTISNLCITPTASDDLFVGYRGLFGGVDGGTIRELTLTNVVIDALATAPGEAQFGSFISIARAPVLSGLTLVGASLSADIQPIQIGDTHSVNVGGFVAEIYDGGTIRDIQGRYIAITVPKDSALSLGGFVAFTDKFDSYESYENIRLSNLTISGHARIGGLAGYMVYGVNHIDGVTVSQSTFLSPGGESGGLVGRLYIYEDTGDCLIENVDIENVTILLGMQGDPGSEIGGMIGTIREYPFGAPPPIPNAVFSKKPAPTAPLAGAWPAITLGKCAVSGGQIQCVSSGGGLVGLINLGSSTEQRALIALCKANIPVVALGEHAGGLVGSCAGTTLRESFASGAASSATGTAGGLIGYSTGCVAESCYATGDISGLPTAGGLSGFGRCDIARCYAWGNVAASIAGGIAGSAGSSTIASSLVLGGAITGVSAHRIIGIPGATLLANYALDTVTPFTGSPDPNGVDGGTITSGQILSTMQTLGWDTSAVWDASSVATLGRPTLLQNPE